MNTLLENFDTFSWLPPFTPCTVCNNGFINDEGYILKCSCRKDYESELSLIQGLLHSGLLHPKSSEEIYLFLKNYSLDNYKGPDNNGNILKIKKFIQTFETKYNSLHLFFSGIPGSQKTTLAKYILTSLLRKKNKGYYILANTLIEKIIDASRNKEDKEFTDYIQAVDFLVIDELDQEKIVTYESGWQKKHLLPWLKTRLEVIKKSTLFISNKPIDNIGAYFEGAIQDLISREVLDKTMIFEDKYTSYRETLDLSKLWEE